MFRTLADIVGIALVFLTMPVVSCGVLVGLWEIVKPDHFSPVVAGWAGLAIVLLALAAGIFAMKAAWWSVGALHNRPRR